jgi:nucleoid-associated protein YgaU
MGKEVKIGLGVVAMLAIVLGVVVFRKVWGPTDLPDAAVESPAADSGDPGDGKSGVGGATLFPAEGGTNGSDLFGSDAGGPRQWVGASDQFNTDPNGGGSGQPRTELMPNTGSSFKSDQRSPLRTDFPSGDRFDGGGLRPREDFGTGRTNVLRPGINDGALNSSSRRQFSDGETQQVDPNMGGLRPTPRVQLRPGPDAIQAFAQSASPQTQYAAQQPTYGTQNSSPFGTAKAQNQYGSATAQQNAAGEGVSAGTSGGTSATSRYAPSTYGSSSYGTSSYGASPYASRGATPGGVIASDGNAGSSALSKSRDSYNTGSQNTGSYTVKPNDSFWQISKKAYGTGDFYKALIEHNRQKFPDPSKIRVGDVVATPTVADLRKNYPVFCPKDRKATSSPYRTAALGAAQSRGQRVYVVSEGDTIFNIARDELGRSARWSEICELNRDLLGDDYDHLKPGWKLVLPGSGSTTRPATGPAVDAGRQDSLTRRIWSKIE